MNTPVRDNQTTSTGSPEQLLTEAVRVLTEAARTSSDFAEFLTHAAAGAAANIGSIDALLAERPGSWEAHYVRDMLTATVGDDEQYLIEHRTEPLVVRVHVDDILNDLSLWARYDEAHEQITRREDAIRARHDVHGDAGEYSADDHDALDELDRLREALDALRDVLDAPIIRFYVTGVFSGRAWALTAAAMTPVPAGIATDPVRDHSPWRRLIGLQAVSGERYVLLDLGYEAFDLYHDRPASEQVTPR